MATSRMTSASSKAKKTSSKRRVKKETPKNPSPTLGAAAKAPKPATRSRKSVPRKSVSKTSTAKKAPAPKKAPASKSAVASKRVAKSVRAKKVAPKKAATKTVAPKKAATKKAATKTVAPKKKSVAKKPVAKKVVKSKLPKKFVAEMKAQLVAERAKYLQTAEDMRAEADSLFADREPGDVQFDEESGEGDTLSVERERGLALSTQAQSAVLQIDEALGRIAAGTYGICVVSGEAIPKERLEAIPWAAMTVRHKVGGLSRR